MQVDRLLCELRQTPIIIWFTKAVGSSPLVSLLMIHGRRKIMISIIRDARFILSCPLLVPFLLAPLSLRAQNEVMGEIQFVAAGDGEKSSGVWVDGLYVGYLKELKGSRKVMLLPGKHEIVA